MTDDVGDGNGMAANDKYLRLLASALRWRRVADAPLRDALQEVMKTTDGSGRSAEEEFGPARDHARTFEAGRSWHPGYVIGNLLGLAVGVTWSLFMLERVLSGESTLLTTIGLSAFAYALALSMVFLGQVIDRRLPRGLDNP